MANMVFFSNDAVCRKRSLEDNPPTPSPSASGMLEGVTATSAIVLTTLRSAGSAVPGLDLTAAIALRIVTLVQEVKGNDGGFVDLANDACGLVYTLIVECRRIITNGRSIPDHIQRHIQTLAGNLASIENFTQKKLKENFLRKALSRTRDIAEIARYREVLKQSLDMYELLQSTVSSQEYLRHLMDEVQQQRAEMEAARRRWIEEKSHANLEEQTCKTEIRAIQEEDRMAEMLDDAPLTQPAEFLEVERTYEDRKCVLGIESLKGPQADEFRRIQEENARLKLERKVLRQRMGETPSPHPQTSLSPTFSGPTTPWMYNPYSYSAQLLSPPQPIYPQLQGGILLQNVSDAHISINSFPPPP